MSSELDYNILEGVNVQSVVKVEINQDILLGNFEKMLEFLKKLGQGQIQIKKDLDIVKSDQEKMQQIVENHKNQIVDHDKSIDGLKDEQKTQNSDINSNKQAIQDNKNAIDKLWDQIKNLQAGGSHISNHTTPVVVQKMPEKSSNDNSNQNNQKYNQGNSGISAEDLQQFQNQLDDLKSQFVTKPEYSDKCQAYDNEIADIWDQINGLKQKIGTRDLGQELDVLKDDMSRKANSQTVNQEIMYIKQLIAKLGSAEGAEKQEIIQDMKQNDYNNEINNALQSQIDDLSLIVQKLRQDLDELLDHTNRMLENHIDLDHDPAHYSNLNSPVKQTRPTLKKGPSQQSLQNNNKIQFQNNQSQQEGNNNNNSRSGDRQSPINNNHQQSNDSNQATKITNNNSQQKSSQDQGNQFTMDLIPPNPMENIPINPLSNKPSIPGSRPQSKLSHLKDVITAVSNTNSSSKRNSKLKVDQNRELIEMLRKDLLRMSGDLELIKKKQNQGPATLEKKQSTIIQQGGNQQNNNNNNSNNQNIVQFDNSQNNQNFQDLFDQNQVFQDQIGNLDSRLADLEDLLKKFATNDDVEQLRHDVEHMTDNLNETQAQSKDNAIKLKDLKRMLENQQKQMSTHANDTTLNITLNDNMNNNHNNSNNSASNNNNNNSSQDGILNGGDNDFNAKLKNLKDYLISLMKALKDDIDRKPSFDDLQKSEAYNLEKLDEVAGALINKLADKGDTKKALQHLEKKINQIYLILAREGGAGHGTEDDALVVKRPLLWSCISCDKYLDKYNGKLGDYKAWKMMPPKETSPERIGKFGRGWKQQIEKKMKINTERMNTDYSNGSNEANNNNTQLPKINKRERGQSYQGQEESQQYQ